MVKDFLHYVDIYFVVKESDVTCTFFIEVVCRCGVPFILTGKYLNPIHTFLIRQTSIFTVRSIYPLYN